MPETIQHMNAWANFTHHAKRHLDRYMHFHTTTQQFPNGNNGTPQINHLPLRRSPPKSNTPIPSPTPLTTCKDALRDLS